jgi:cysteine peptidase C11 family protein
MAKSRWTILTYIAAHNNLAMLGKVSLNQILGVGSTPDVVHGMLYDGPGEGGRFIVGNPGTVSEQDGFDEFDGGDPDQLIATARWLFEKHPADRYGLVLWSHGTGWRPEEIAQVAAEARPDAAAKAESHDRAGTPGSYALFRSTLRALQRPPARSERAILFDDGTGHSLDTLELQRVMDTLAETVGQPLELLGMDACLMASLEVAYQIKGCVRALVASSELVPGHSWPYSAIYGAVRNEPEMSGTALARLAVEQYVQFYTANPPAAGDVTKVALDLGKVESIAAAARTLADTLMQDMAKHTAVIWNAQRDTQTREAKGGKRKPSKFDFHLWDLGSLAAGIAANPTASDAVRKAASSVTAALEPGGAVLAEGHRGDWFDGIGGLNVYLVPPGIQRVSPAYGQLAFAREMHWLDMLTKYHELQPF